MKNLELNLARLLVLLVALVVALCFAFSCTSHKHTDKSKTEVKENIKQEVNTSDKITEEITEEKTTSYGDTLNGSLTYDSSNKVDSIESDGIKVKGTLVKTANGEKIILTAISKPVLKTDKVTIKKQEQVIQKATTSIKADSTNAQQHKAKEVKDGIGFPWFLLLILLAITGYGIYRKFKK
jgi:hypothetical protein